MAANRTSYNRDKVLPSFERKQRDTSPLDRISVLMELISRTVDELTAGRK